MANSDTKVCVAVRVRPLIERERNSETGNNWSVSQDMIQQIDPVTGNNNPNSVPYLFDHVFDSDAKTVKVYNEIVAPIVREALNGFNGTILCYGQTSSGKTFTLFGNDNEEGIISLAAQDLFKHISQDQSRNYIIRVGLVEIYNEKVTDLLNPGKLIEIKEVNGVIVPKDLEEMEVLKPEDLLKSAKRVQELRKIGETQMNKESSRSHTVLRIAIESVPKREFSDGDDTDDVHVTDALLNFVDLAGSEKAGQTGAVGDRFKEATFINKSLLVLSQVVMQLSEDSGSNINSTNPNTPFNHNTTLLASTSKPKAAKFVNYRDSKLTRLLQSSLSGNAYIVMICNVTPACISIDETHSTLRFARTAKKIKTKPKANHILPASAKYQQKIKELQALLGGKSSEVEELKRQLGIYMNFSHNKRSLSTADQDSNPQNDSKRRRTWCPGQLKLIREEKLSSHIVQANLNDSDSFEFTPPPSSSRVLRSHTRSSLNTPSDVDKPNTTERFMTHEEAVKHFRVLSEEKGRDSWPDEGLLSNEELLKITFDREVQTDPMSPISSLKPPLAKKQRLDVNSTPVLRKVRLDLTSALLNDKLEWQSEKDFLQAELAGKDERIQELERLLDELRELNEIRTLGELLQESLMVETCEIAVNTDTVICKTTDVGTSSEQVVMKDSETHTDNLVEWSECATNTEVRETADTATSPDQVEFSVCATNTEIRETTDTATSPDQVEFSVCATNTEIRETTDTATSPDYVEFSECSTNTEVLETADTATSPEKVAVKDSETYTDNQVEFSECATNTEVRETADTATSPDQVELSESATNTEIRETADTATSPEKVTMQDSETYTDNLIEFSECATNTEVRESVDTATSPDVVVVKDSGTYTDNLIEFSECATNTEVHQVDMKDSETYTDNQVEFSECATNTEVRPTTDTGTSPHQVALTDSATYTDNLVEFSECGTNTKVCETADIATSPDVVSVKDSETYTDNQVEFSERATNTEAHQVDMKDSETFTDNQVEFSECATNTEALETADSATSPDQVAMKDSETYTDNQAEFSECATNTEVHEIVDTGTSPDLVDVKDSETYTDKLIEFSECATNTEVHQVDFKDSETCTENLVEFSECATNTEICETADISTSPDQVAMKDSETYTENQVELLECATNTEVLETVDTSTSPNQVEFSECGTNTKIRETADTATSPEKVAVKESETCTENQVEFSESATNTKIRETADIATSPEKLAMKDSETYTENQVELSECATNTEPINIGTAPDKISKVNRGVQTSEETDLKCQLRNLQIMVKMRERELSDLKDASKLESASDKSRIIKLEANLSTTLSEINGLKAKLNTLSSDSEHNRRQQLDSQGVKRKMDSEIQCDVIIEQANRALSGVRGLLPKGFPDIGIMNREVKRLRQANLMLDSENKKCTCKGMNKDSKVNFCKYDSKSYKPSGADSSATQSSVQATLISKLFKGKKQSTPPPKSNPNLELLPTPKLNPNLEVVPTSATLATSASNSTLATSVSSSTLATSLSSSETKAPELPVEDDLSWLDEIGSDSYMKIFLKKTQNS